MVKRLFLVGIAFVLLACQPKKVFSPTEIALIPKPNKMELGNSSFSFNAQTKWLLTDSNAKEAALLLQQKFKTAAGFQYQNIISTNPDTENVVIFQKDTTLSKEEYTLNISPQNVKITASNLSGYLYAVQTLRQLLPNAIEENVVQHSVQWIVPTLSIQDKPQYKWRGVMLDVARHFFPKSYILKTLDRMAFLKMNTLHLHLVDDQGWRLEIKKYPKLTEVGAWRVDQENTHWDGRKPNAVSDKATYGGFYTQQDIREIVAYAHSLGIAVVPEIEIPAHVTSAIAAYPFLSCHKKPIAVPSGGVWPITDIYCAGDEAVYSFLEDVISEVNQLFPDLYVHIGGDEATRTEWEKCPACQKRMKQKHIENTAHLQGYMVSRIGKMLSDNNKKLIGWDEILESDIPAQAIIMSWRGEGEALKAVQKGHQVIMTPNTCYFDQYQGLPKLEPLAIGGYVPLKKVYQYDPTLQIPDDKKSLVIGAQANLWSEYIPSESHSEYMLYPRLLALSEVLWSAQSERNWDDFIRRLQLQLPRWQIWQVNYSKSMYQVVSSASFVNGKLQVELHTDYPRGEIRYTINSPDFSSSHKYTNPITIDSSVVLRSAVFENEIMQGAVSIDTLTFHKAVNKPVHFQVPYHKNYQGQGETTLTNVVRGTTNFHDKQWLAWLGNDAQFTVDMQQLTPIKHIRIGIMQNQGQGIYYPAKIKISLSKDANVFSDEKVIEIPYIRDGFPRLKDVDFYWEDIQAQFVRIECINSKAPNGGDAWIFLDEVQIN